jgi:hypothetical protein
VARLAELLFFVFLVYFAYRRIASPIRRGYAERERERRKEAHGRATTPSKLDRTGVRDADFKDLA